GEVVGTKESPGGMPVELWRKLLATDPAERFASAADVDAALEPLTRPVRLLTRRAWFAITGGAITAAGRAATLPRPWAGRSAGTEDPTPPAPSAPVASSGPVPGKLPQTPEQAAALQRQWADYIGRPVKHTGPLGITFALIPPGELGLSTE